jgi:hypothetical protein
MRNPFMFRTQLMNIYIYIYIFSLRYKNKLSIGFIYKYVHLYSTVFMSALKMFRTFYVSDFGISDKGYSTCTNTYKMYFQHTHMFRKINWHPQEVFINESKVLPASKYKTGGSSPISDLDILSTYSSLIHTPWEWQLFCRNICRVWKYIL